MFSGSPTVCARTLPTAVYLGGWGSGLRARTCTGTLWPRVRPSDSRLTVRRGWVCGCSSSRCCLHFEFVPLPARCALSTLSATLPLHIRIQSSPLPRRLKSALHPDLSEHPALRVSNVNFEGRSQTRTTTAGFPYALWSSPSLSNALSPPLNTHCEVVVVPPAPSHSAFPPVRIGP